MTITSCQKKSIILVTGGTGFIASHVIDTLLRAPLDYYVRFTSRAIDRADATLEHFGKRYGLHRIQAVVIEDLEADAAYDQAVKGVSGIIDLASPPRVSGISLNSLVNSAVRTVESILKSASKESSVKRVVHCSSVLSAGHGNPATFGDVVNGTVRPVYLTPKSWNKAAESWNQETEVDSAVELEEEEDSVMQVDGEHQRKMPTSKANAKSQKCLEFANKYGIMKAKAEKAAFNFVADHQPNFIFTTVLSAVVFGTVLPASSSVSTAGWLLKFSNKPPQKSPLYSSAISQLGCPIENNFPPQSFVDVNDLALLFYSVLVTPSLEKNERIFASTSSFSWNDILRVLHELNPDLSKTSLVYLTGERDRVDHTVIDNGRFLELLEIKGSRANCLYTSVSNTMRG